MHVRECDMNQTPDGSYYASEQQIKDAQRRYRLKTLKQFLRSGEFKGTRLQNAIVLELTTDLSELGIDAGALLHFKVDELLHGE
jgi:hypothetical protein